MKNRRFIFLTTFCLLGMTLLIAFPSWAEETVKELKAQIEALQNRVEQLEQAAEQPASPVPAGGGYAAQRQRNVWDPFEEMARMQEEMDLMFQSSFSRRGLGGPGMFSSNIGFDAETDIKETKKGYTITFDMVGLDKDKVDIQINENSITVKGEHNGEETQEDPGQYFQVKSFGSFMKTIPLPADADTTKVKTEKQDDTLVITLPKKKT